MSKFFLTIGFSLAFCGCSLFLPASNYTKAPPPNASTQKASDSDDLGSEGAAGTASGTGATPTAIVIPEHWIHKSNPAEEALILMDKNAQNLENEKKWDEAMLIRQQMLARAQEDPDWTTLVFVRRSYIYENTGEDWKAIADLVSAEQRAEKSSSSEFLMPEIYARKASLLLRNGNQADGIAEQKKAILALKNLDRAKLPANSVFSSPTFLSELYFRMGGALLADLLTSTLDKDQFDEILRAWKTSARFFLKSFLIHSSPWSEKSRSELVDFISQYVKKIKAYNNGVLLSLKVQQGGGLLELLDAIERFKPQEAANQSETDFFIFTAEMRRQTEQFLKSKNVLLKNTKEH